MGLTVGFDATAAATQSAGIGRYVRELLAALDARDDDIGYHLYYCSGGSLAGSLPRLDTRFRVRALPLSDRITNIIWHRARLPIPVQLVTGKFDLFHSPDFTLPPTLAKPTMLTVHDLAFMAMPECAYPTLRMYLEKVVPRSARRATKVIAVSESTRRDVIHYIDIPPENVVTLLEGVGEAFHPVQDADEARTAISRGGLTQPYILSVGTLEPRKNYVRLLEAYALLREKGIRHQLVIAGSRGWLYEPIFRRLRQLRLEEYVTFVRPDDATLASLYGLADLFVFPSLYEGFGMPPLEALACGAPVACSSASSMPEVVGDAALLFDPRDVEQIFSSMEQILSDDALQLELKRKGPEQAKRFSWPAVAERTVQLYRALASHA